MGVVCSKIEAVVLLEVLIGSHTDRRGDESDMMSHL